MAAFSVVITPFPQSGREQPQEGVSLTLQELLIKLGLQGSKAFSHRGGHSSREMVLVPWAEGCVAVSDGLAWPTVHMPH